jgi:methane monooxygenase PmoA-like
MSRPGNSPLAIAAAAALTIALVATLTRSAGAGIGRPFGADRTRFLPVAVTPNEAARRVDVTIGGRPFTSYVWPERLKKPVLYPLRSAAGTLVTRGWPFDPRPGERVDHPHHVGLWFDYGDVNGVDFWNNSDALEPAEAAKMGVILHRRIVETHGGADSGSLVAEMDWIGPGSVPFLRERAAFTFRGDAVSRTVERVTTLTALDRRVVFNDNKEGLFGMRVARQLEQPSTKAEVFTDARGKATPVPVLDNAGVTGSYTSSEGKTGDDVWSTRGRWAMLTGTIGPEALTLAILDHPKNFGFPTYWHARGYGLFAANPLGQKVFTEDKQPALNLTLEPRASATFRYRVLILEGKATADRLEREFTAFAADQLSRRGF